MAVDPAGLRRNAETISREFNKRGVKTKFLQVEGAPAVVYGEMQTAGAQRTVTFYAHYDGSPLNAKEWTTPPFEPVLRAGALDQGGKVIPLPEAGQSFDPEWRIYARSAGDDKAPFIGILAALDALRASRIKPTSNLKFVFEGEEEAGSQHFAKIISNNLDLLKSDVWLICDGPVHQSGLPEVAFGARGLVTATLTVYGARRELHSGHFGNWAPNPAMMLAQLLASMKGEDGRVLIEHFYDGVEPLSEAEKKAVAAAPEFERQLKHDLWLGRSEGGGRSLAELINLPSFNIRGFTSGRTDSASNVIPATATAAVDIRLVKGISHERALALLRSHIERHGYFIVDAPPSASVLTGHEKVLYLRSNEFAYDAVRTPMELPIAQVVLKAVSRARAPLIALPTMGASLPLMMIEQALHVPTVITPIANYDDSQHTFDENLRLGNLWDGIDQMAALLTMQWKRLTALIALMELTFSAAWQTVSPRIRARATQLSI